ncbi:MAG: RNA polymerase factor sigma-54 [Neomegalonema sp.]|nr:RNA polymerase factor sigma-54 [Neomegalonema sp.]
MSFAQRLDMRQSQNLVMTPQLQQAIKMLQMSNIELQDYVHSEMERNPLLEAGDERDRAREAAESPPDKAAPESDGVRCDVALAEDRLERASETFDTGRENIFADEAVADRQGPSPESGSIHEQSLTAASAEAGAWSTVGKGGSSRFEDESMSLEGRLSEELTLRQTLLQQLGRLRLSPAVRLIAADIVEQLDECGYFRSDLSETAMRLGATLEECKSALRAVQSLEPTGVGARSLKECLSLQLSERNRLDPAMAVLIENLELLAKREAAKLRKMCGVDDDDLREMVREIRALDPKPGRQFAHEPSQTVSPDVFVIDNGVNGWSVELNAETMPRVLLNNRYAAEVSKGLGKGKRADEVKEYLAECHQSANWLVKSIDQRAKTILRVASEIVRQQDGFFAFGVAALRPLNLKRVAEAIDMHESTVSRVTSNKYVATPRGIFELKYFFTPPIASTRGGEEYSAEAIRHRVKALIDGERPDDVLSDDRIVAILRGAGVDIARRTVTKYREALGVPSSIQRRREKSAVTVF